MTTTTTQMKSCSIKIKKTPVRLTNNVVHTVQLNKYTQSDE